ncbi:sperm-associated antigen 17-like isoform X2 [Acanthaster planci]|uniref:Sperm-associated antigen 17-like isoform X2 n=1 Tax=Acanthaster planci TaxID=133434 RepID=A0A8B7XPU0_ACAPL|nr:sperm-associated antigen 17-like isoform X2 [Acanthaster planci]
MSKKRAKSGGSAGVSRWDSGIVQAPFEEENWKASITFIVGQRLEDYEHTKVLCTAVHSGLRKLFSVISKDLLSQEVQELGNAKTKKPKDVPAFSEICEAVKPHLDNNEDVPMPLLAKLLKWKLLAIKQKDMKRREDERKAADGKDGKDKKGGKDKRARSKSPVKGKGKNKSPEIPSPKKESKLKKRGEEEDNNKYIDDEPDDGPEHYVVIEGFDRAPLLALLCDLGVNVDSIIKVGSEDYERFARLKAQEEEEEEEEKPPEVVEAERVKREKAVQRLETFWQQHEPLLRSAPKESKLHDIARLAYTVKSKIIPEDMEDNELRTEFGTALFEDIACMMYDLLDSKRQFLNYLDNMKLIQIPSASKPAMPPAMSEVHSGASLTTSGAGALTAGAPTDLQGLGGLEQKPPLPEVDMRYYSELMDSLPHESVSVPIIMHCMLEQITATEEDKLPPSEKAQTPRDDGLDPSLAAHIEGMTAKLHMSAKEKENIDNSFNSLASKTSPSTVNGANNGTPHFYRYGDAIARRLHHLRALNGFNPLEAELAMMDYIPVAKLREFPRPCPAVLKQRAARLQELLQHCASGAVDQAEVDHAFRQFVFESLKLRGTDADGLVLRSETEDSKVIWDDPYPLFVSKEDDSTRQGQTIEIPIPLAVIDANQLPSDKPCSKPGSAKSTQSDQTSGGILKNEPAASKSRQGSASSAKSARSTVHFEKDASGKPVLPAAKEAQPASSSQPTSENSLSLELPGAAKSQRSRPGSAGSIIGVQDIGERQQRNLDEWRYAEYLEPSVLLQVLQEAREVYPYMDTYYHKRDHSLLVVLHNPMGPNLMNHEPWSTKLHSNVGFRNYMEHVADYVKDWTAEEEDKYQAEVRRKELEAMRAAAAATPSPSVSRPSSGKSRARSGSPKKSRSKSPKGKRSVSPTHSVDNLDPNSGSFMRPNSMKAWKLEQDKIREEEEKKRLEKEKKGRPRSRSRSGSPKKEDREKKDDKKDKRAVSPSKESGRNSKKGTKGDKGGAGAEEEKGEEGPTEEPKEPEREYPFVGYDVGNDLIHASGFVTTLLPCDGGQIRTEKTEFVDGPTFVKTSVLKDGHMFVIHMLNPRAVSEDELAPKTSPEEAMVEKAEHETQEKDQAPVAKETNLLKDLMDEDGADSLASEALSIKSGSMSGSQYAESRDGDSPTKGVTQQQQDAPLDSTKAPEPAEEKPGPVSSFGSFTATLSDGMVFALSNYGSKGVPFGAEPKQEVEIYVPPPNSPSPPPTISSPKGTRAGSGKKGKKQQQQQQQQEAERQAQLQLEQQQKEEEERKRRAMEEALKKAQEPKEPPFQQLFVSCPDGLHVNYLLEKDAGVVMADSKSTGRLLVRQCYPYKTSGRQECESARQVPAMQERSRLITSDGSVIKMMKDGNVQVLFADGAVSVSQGPSSRHSSLSRAHSREPSPQRGGSAISTQVSDAAVKKGSVRGPPSKSGTAVAGEKPADDLPDPGATEDPGAISEWVTTARDGARIGTRADGSTYELKACMMYSATDPMTYEVMSTREDRVVILQRPDGSRIIDHNEGTRITTYYNRVELVDDFDEHAETGEEPSPRFKLVKHYKVECPGYATVIFNSEDSLATTIFGSGTEIISIPNGSYEVLHHEGGRVTVKSEGTVEYIPAVARDHRESKAYTMRHQNPLVFEMQDLYGNCFVVRSTGETKVVRSASCNEDMDEMGVNKDYCHHLPKFFVINEDGSGVELLRGEDIEGYLEQASLDPNTAILTDPLPDHPDVNGITVMRPYMTGLSKAWLTTLDEPNIVPPNLCSRDFARFPPRELKHPGPKFGTDVGKGLAVGSRLPVLRSPPVPVCPSKLEIRQFIEYKPISEELRQKMRLGLEAYAKEMQSKDQQWAEQELKEPRDEAEKVKAGELLASILAQDEQDVAAPMDSAADNAPQQVSKSVISTTKPRAVTSGEEAKALYEKATAPAPQRPLPKPKNKYTQEDWDRVKRELAEELTLRKALRNHEVPPYFQSAGGESFLLSQAASAGAGSKAPDMEVLTKDLAQATRQGEGGTQPPRTAFSLPSTPSESPASQQQAGPDSSRQSDPSESTSPRKQPSPSNPTISVPISSSSPADVRPTNPTPAHAGGQGTPTPLRPNNPTPAHASQQQEPTARPGNPTPGGNTDNANNQNAVLPSETPSSYASFPNHPSTIPEHADEGAYTDRSGYTDGNSVSGNNQDEGRHSSSQPDGNGTGMEGDAGIPSANSDLVLTKSLLVDVNGEPRKESVRLPAAILGQKPGMVPNEHFQVLEDPVRRKVNTSSIAGAEAKGIAPLSKMRGFELVPGEVHFGTLREGCTYAFSVHLKNCGIDTCRYKVKQPPPATGLQVVYTPGPVSAGMKAVLELQLYAIAVGVTGDSGQGSIGHHVEIITEMEQLYLPVTANILTANEYDERCHTQGTPRVSAGVRLISARPPSREGIIRPRKTQQPGTTLEADSQLVQ